MSNNGEADQWDPTVYEFDSRPSEISPDAEELPPRIAVIRTSDRLMFRRCRRRWGWNSHLRGNIGPKQNASPLWMGSGFHFALEDCHGENHYGHPTAAFQAYTDATIRQSRYNLQKLPGDLEELRVLAIGMLEYYWDEWLKNRDPLTTFIWNGKPQVEVNFRVEIPIEVQAYGYDKVYYSGTIDRVAIDEHGQLWIVEYKTAKAIQTMHLDNDTQVSSYCVPLATEILTRTGWKTYDQLVVGEEVMGFNTETKQNEWTTLRKINLPGKQKVNRISGKSFSFVATPDHKWVKGVKMLGTAYKNNPRTEIRLATSEQNKGQSHFIFSAPYIGGTNSMTADEAAVLGWILTDGTHTRMDCISIAQSKPEHVKNIQALLDRIGNCYSRVSDHPDGHKRWHLRSPFTDMLWNKAGLDTNLSGWEVFLCGLSFEALDAFCEAAIDGDGHRGPNGTQFFQNQGLKHELFKLAFFLRGQFPTKSSGTAENAWSNNTDYNTFTISEPRKWCRQTKVEAYGEEEVWCPTTDLGTWVMRQGGQIAITGNCWAGSLLYDRPITGVIYQQHRKDTPRQPKILMNGRLSTDKNQLITHSSLRKYITNIYGTVEKAGPVYVDMLNYLSKQETSDKDKFVQRDRARRNAHQREAEGVKILMETEEMLNPNLPLYPNPDRTCKFFCPFEGACVSIDDGSDWEYELDILMEKRDANYDSWRKYLRDPEVFSDRESFKDVPGFMQEEKGK